MTHYLTIFFQDQIGEWHARFPGVPNCEARGFTLRDVILAAPNSLMDCILNSDAPPPAPQDLEAATEQLSKDHIRLSEIIVSMVDVAPSRRILRLVPRAVSA